MAVCAQRLKIFRRVIFVVTIDVVDIELAMMLSDKSALFATIFLVLSVSVLTPPPNPGSLAMSPLVASIAERLV
jgi:hypothetical protein